MRALQPPFLAFVQKLVPVEKWDARKRVSVAKKQATFMLVMSGLWAMNAIGYLSNPKSRLMGVAWLGIAVLTALLSFMNFRNARKANT